MPRNQRITLLALAAVVVVVAVVIAIAAGGGDDDVSTTAATTTAPATAPAPAATEAAPESTATAPPAETTTTAPEPRRPVVVVRDGQPVDGVQKLEFDKGDTIDFAVRSDTPGEIHLHGYDVHRDVPAGGGTVRFTLPAKFDGRFEVEIEATGTLIAELEVQP